MRKKKKNKLKLHFSKELEDGILKAIRENIYSKYPKKSLKKSSLFFDGTITIKKNPLSKDMTTGWSAKVIYTIITGFRYEIYYKNKLVAEIEETSNYIK